MPLATIVIKENGPASSSISADVRDLQHAHRLLLQALLAMNQEGEIQIKEPTEKLALLRGFLVNLGITDIPSSQRLLIMALFQLADEAEGKRIVLSTQMSKIAF